MSIYNLLTEFKMAAPTNRHLQTQMDKTAKIPSVLVAESHSPSTEVWSWKAVGEMHSFKETYFLF